MSNVTIKPWQITHLSPVNDYCQTIFSVGNGRLGIRGFGAWSSKTSLQDHAVFRAGLFSSIKSGITDMVQLPDVFTLIPVGELPTAVNQTLDMQTGVVTHSWETQRASFEMKRCACMADEQLILQTLSITAEQAGEYLIQAIADADVANLPVHDDQTIIATELTQILELDEKADDHLLLHTRNEGTRVSLAWELKYSQKTECTTAVDENRVITTLKVYLAQGECFTAEKRVRIRVEGEPSTQTQDDPWQANAAAWDKLWQDCDILVEANDPDMQGALRYNIFQLLCNNASQDRKVSIGARGLTHGRYKGNTFWDTDVFMLPFYLWTRPQAARNLLYYRTDKLADAKALAKKQNLDGARYPWMCADTGAEQCESWDIGLCEVHITADIAYAAERYLEVTGDEAFLKNHAAELYRETARYWCSRLTYEPAQDCYSSFFVKGPDEYCGAANNNTFTNYMARYNLQLALEKGELSTQEQEQMQNVADRIKLLYDEKRDLYLQDETLDRLPPFIKDDDTPSYKSVCFDRMQRYRALKQADLVLLVTLFPFAFTPQQKRVIFETYEPITLHDSTLSFAVHAQLAFRLKLWEKAEQYLHKGLYLDLQNVMGNTGNEGVHVGACGAAWQALVFGAAGLWAENGEISLEPCLPPSIQSLTFHAYHHGKRLKIHVDHTGQTIGEE